jgi:alcohol dehydrogenase class IV
MFTLLTRTGSMHFDFATSARIAFGPGVSQDLPVLVERFGQKGMLIADSKDRAAWIENGLRKAKIDFCFLLVVSEPKLDDVLLAIRIIIKEQPQFIIAYGGGAAIDTGKAAGVLSANPGSPFDYLEIVGSGRSLTRPPLPLIAVPTTAGTGSEVTRNAVINIPEKHVKVSLRSPWMLPSLALVDPALTCSLPPFLTASTGMDALTQLIEPFVCNSPNPMVDAFCRDAIPRAAKTLPQAYKNGSDLEAREGMSYSSLLGGLALANARLGAVHGLAAVLGGMYAAPHGAICARLLPTVVGVNIQALKERDRNGPGLGRYSEIARLLTGDPYAAAEDAVSWLIALRNLLGIPTLSTFGVEQRDIPLVVAESQKASSMKGNPIELTPGEISSILEAAL